MLNNGEKSVQTDADGKYSFTSVTAAQAAAPIVVITDDTTTDKSSGTVQSGVTLKAAAGSAVVSPITTLAQENGLTAAQVAKALGLSSDINPLTFNPYGLATDASAADKANALAVEKVSQQIITSINAIAGVADGAGATQADAFAKTLGALADVVKAKADAGKTLDFKVQADLDLIKTGVTNKLTADTSFDSTKQGLYDAAIVKAVTGAKNINDKIGGITSTDLTLQATKNIFSTTQLLKDQAKEAGTGTTAGLTNFKLHVVAELDTAIANQAPTDLSALTKTSVVEGTTGAGLVLGTVVPTDATSGDTFTFAVVGKDAGYFTINTATGALSLKVTPDFETKASYSISIKVTDAGGKSYVEAYTIAVTDVNEAPTDLTLSKATIAENTTAAGIVSTTDPDKNDSFTYALTGGADVGAFNIDASTGVLSLKVAPDFETVSVSHTCSVEVTVTDAGGKTYTETLAITVTDVNEAPTDLSFNALSSVQTVSIAENTTAVGTIITTDPDKNDTVTYTLSGTNSGLFSITAGGVLSLNNAPDFETMGASHTYSVDIMATDGGARPGGGITQTLTKTFTITVTDVNETPTDLTLSSASIGENTAIGTTIGRITTTDPDHKSGDTYSYTLSGTDGGDFNISAAGDLSLKAKPDFETKNTYSVEVTTTDAGDRIGGGSPKSYKETFTITVTDVDPEAPTDLFFSTSSLRTASILENSQDLVIGTMKPTDTDQKSGEAYSYALSGTDVGAFNINASTGALSLKNAPNYELKSSYSVDVKVTDADGQHLTKTFTIGVTDVNEKPVFAKASDTGAVTDDAAAGTVIYTAVATDPDASSAAVIYSISSGGDKVQIDSNGIVTLKAIADISATPIAFTVKATDGADTNLFSTQDVSITVAVNTAPTFSKVPGTSLKVDENADTSTAIYTATATDPDATPTPVIYSISGGVDAGKVVIDAATGKVTLRDPANRATDLKYDFTIKATDSTKSTLFATQDVSVAVTNQNEAPTAANKYVDMATGTERSFSASDFGFSDADADSVLSKVKIVGVHNSQGGKLTFKGADLLPNAEIAVADISSLKYTPGQDEVGDAYARISFKVSDGTTYSESANHIGINVQNAQTPASSSEALKASWASGDGQTYRLLDKDLTDTSLSADDLLALNRLMTGGGWTTKDSGHDQMYMTYSFYQSSSAGGYNSNSAGFTASTQLIPMGTDAQTSVRTSLNQIEKFTNIKFIEVADTATDFGDLRFTIANSAFMNDAGGIGSFPGRVDSYGGYLSRNGDVFLKQYTDAQFAAEGSAAGYIVLHEIGHALGLAHPFHQGTTNPYHTFGTRQDVGKAARDSVLNTVMSYGFKAYQEPDPTVSTYMVDDVLAFQKLYGTNTVFSVGDNIYDYKFFSADTSGFIKSVYDSGGTDVFDFSNQGFETRGTLNKNDYLFIDGNPTNGNILSATDLDILSLQNYEGAIGMANSQIERFFGGAGADTITASSTGSVLFGGFGLNVIDTFTGGAGADTFLVHDSGFAVSKTECDVIKNFVIGQDKIGLESGLSYADITIEYFGSDAYIKNSAGSYLLKLVGITSSSGLTASHFDITTYLSKSLGILENNAPVILSGSDFKVATTSKDVGYVSTKDINSDRLHYSLDQTTGDHSKVKIDRDNGLITLTDFLAKDATLSVTVKVTDGIAITTKTFSIIGSDDAGVVSVFGRETEPNNTILTADVITLGTKITGAASSYVDKDHFELPTTAKGTISVAFSNFFADIIYSHHVSILDAVGNVLSSKWINGVGTIVAEVAATAKYYVLVDESLDTNAYSLTATHSTKTGTRETEPNDTILTADILTTATSVTGQKSIIGQTSSFTDDDYYKLDVMGSGEHQIFVNFDDGAGSSNRTHLVSILDTDGITILSSISIWSDNALKAYVNKTGTYYVKVENSYDTTDYTLKVKASSLSAGIRESEPNNTIAKADDIKTGVFIKGHTSSYADDDYYKLLNAQNLDTISAGTITVTFDDGTISGTASTRGNYKHSVSIVDAAGNVLSSKDIYRPGTMVAEVGSSGKYYVKIDNSYDARDYTVKATYTTTKGAREIESNDNRADANLLALNTTITGQTSSGSTSSQTGDKDYYKFDVAGPGTITVSMKSASQIGYAEKYNHTVYILDNNPSFGGYILSGLRTSGNYDVVTEVGGTTGVSASYYVVVKNSDDKWDYQITVKFDSTVTGKRETEPNDTILTADLITSTNAIIGQTSLSNDLDYYALAATSAGTISVAFADNGAKGNAYLAHRVSIVDAAGNVLSSQKISVSGTVVAEIDGAPKYYVKVFNSLDKGDYTLTATYSTTTKGVRETEPNNDRTHADALALGTAPTAGKAIIGQTSSFIDDDYYALTVTKAGTISVAFNDGSGLDFREHVVSIISHDGTTETILSTDKIYSSGTVTAVATTVSGLTFYVKVDNSHDTADYTLSATYADTIVSSRETEPNNTILTADTIVVDAKMTGQISSSSDNDYYKLAVSGAGTISVDFDDGLGGFNTLAHKISIIDASGNVLSSQDIYSGGTMSAIASGVGNYYVKVGGSSDTADDYTITAKYSTTVAARETESNNTILTADTITSGTAISGAMSNVSDNDYYMLGKSLTTNTITVTFNDGAGSDIKGHSVSIVDANGVVLSSKNILFSGTLQAAISASTSANYYVLVGQSLLDTADYVFTATYSTTVDKRETELNNTILTADVLTLDPTTSTAKITGQSSALLDKDYYELATVQAGTITVTFNDEAGSYLYQHGISIVDKNGAILSSARISSSGTVTAEVAADTAYYVLIDNGHEQDDYSLTAKFDSATTGKRETELNNTILTADTITSATQIIGQTSSHSDDDYYALVVTDKGTISLVFDDGVAGSDHFDHAVSIIGIAADGTTESVLSLKNILSNGTVTAEVDKAATYYVKVDNSYDTADYSVTTTFATTNGVRETEPNNSFATADTIATGTTITGQSSTVADNDYFKIDVAGASTIRITFTSNGNDQDAHDLRLYDASQKLIFETRANGNGVHDLTLAGATTIYGYVGNSYDQDDYTVGWSEVV